MQKFRPVIASGPLCLLTALYVLIFTNISFWRAIGSYYADSPWRLVGIAVALLALHVALFVFFSAKFIIKPMLILFVLIAAGGSYFTDTFGTIIDKYVVEAALTTTKAESGALLTPSFLWHMLIFGVVPSLLIAWVRVKHRPILGKLMVNTGVILACLIVSVTILGSNYAAYSSMFREHGADIMQKLMPSTPIASTIQYVSHVYKNRTIVMQPLGVNARQTLTQLPAGKKLVTVVVVGETARAQNFSLNGYARETNPELKQQGVIAFTNTTSCGTETSVSVPCMFSPFTREDYSSTKFRGSENLMDVLKHAGVQTSWYENNTGSKGVAERIKLIDLQGAQDKRYCEGGECLDQILIDSLSKELSETTGNATIVLHMTGSHGPAYYRRYPAEYAGFKPDCRSNDFVKCSQEEIVNAYDNSILYTDHILSEVIDLLKAHEDKFASAMIYMSDHGESLGEDGLYLHAAPYFIAPSQQTHIPFITWFAPEYAADTGLNADCLRKTTAEPSSHDNVFHTVLGMMAVKTSVYDQKLDRFATCRAPHDVALN
ncbi:phosphoethanolamine--lipid A transferase [Ochrobactrum sp. Marseille-Q0166]|uniref:phosphoethanolamine transferase n=1 Tax=Ochrobactrum sp. Marseille-Q0166 TaxID=2761105 RepID=UPI001654FDBD|nr:phosphoethanolamine--lipid A transferase [Ochrobactrum sp. Marseille-Q0166]MBC8718423.1 phosphoethanolamine transferase [Ochrobactrum sp. Marseille-Q0166]